MTAPNRLTKKGSGSGRRFKRFKKGNVRDYKALGGIPMKIVNGKIHYAKYVPHNYTKKYSKEKGEYYEDKESNERQRAIIHQERGDIARIMIYEIRFDIKSDETDDERRKREYREWWEKRNL